MSPFETKFDVGVTFRRKNDDGDILYCYPMTRDVDVALTVTDDESVLTLFDKLSQIDDNFTKKNGEIETINSSIEKINNDQDSNALDSMKNHIGDSGEILKTVDTTGQTISFKHKNYIPTGTTENNAGTISPGDSFKIPVITWDNSGHITAVSSATMSLSKDASYDLAEATADTIGGIRLGDNMTMLNGKLNISKSTSEIAGVTKITDTITETQSDSATTEKAVYTAIEEVKQFATTQAQNIFNSIMGGSSPEQLDTITELAAAIEKLGTVDEGFTKELSEKAPKDHTHLYAASTSAGGSATSVDTSDDLLTEMSVLAVDPENPTAVKRNSKVKVKGGSVIADEFIGTLSGSVSGNAGTASKLNSPVNISVDGAASSVETSFDGSSDIVIPITSLSAEKLTGTAKIDTTGNAATSSKLASAVNISVGSSTKMFDGSEPVSFSLDEVGAASVNHEHPDASTITSGLMTPDMVKKLNSIEEGANKITDTNQLTNTAGFLKSITKDMVTGALGYVPPEQDTTYKPVSPDSNGLMTPALLTKLNGIAEGATNVTDNNQIANGAGYITGINKSMVTTALGYTPPTQDTTYDAASAISDGLMTSEMVTKLNGIAEGATNVTDNNQIANGAGYITGITKEMVTTALGYTPTGSDTTYEIVTEDSEGLMSPAMLTKLNGIAEGANRITNNNQIANGAGYITGIDKSMVTTALGTGTGTAKYLREDGTWATPPDTDTKYSKLSQFTNDTGFITGITGLDVTTALGYTPPKQDTTYETASATSDGLMTSKMVTKLNGIAEGANKYTHPAYTAKASGLYKVTVDATGHVSATTAVTKADITALGIPGSDTWQANVLNSAGYVAAPTSDTINKVWKTDADGNPGWRDDENTVYDVASATSDGLMTSEMVTKLNSIADGANRITNNNQLTNGAGYITGITKEMVTTALGYTPPTQDTTYETVSSKSNGLMTPALLSKLNGIAEGANKYTHPSYTAKASGLYKVTVDATGHVSATTAVTKADITALGIPGSDTNTDTKVTQTAVAPADYTNWRTILWGSSNSTTEGFSPATVTDGVYTDINLSYQPSSGTLRAKNFKGTVNGYSIAASVPSGAKFTDTWRPLGTSADTACAGNDSRLSNARPASDVYAWAKASSKPSYSKSEVGLGNVDNTADSAKSVKYATSAGSASSASSASAVADYNAPTKTIQIGFSGNGIAGDEIKYIAGYTTGDGNTVNAKIKDISKDAFKSWLGLGSLAYSSAAGSVSGVYIQASQPGNPSDGYYEWYRLLRTE